MSNQALRAALGVTLENLEDNVDLLETLVVEANELTPQEYVEDRIAVEQDVAIIQTQADELDAAVNVSHEKLDAAVALVNAVAGRYNGFKLKSTGLESVDDASKRVAPTVAQFRELSVALESALTVTLEEYAMKDMWSHIGILNREIPNMADKIAVLGNYDGKTRIRLGQLTIIFTVDDEVSHQLDKAAAGTASVLNDLLSLGEEAVSVAQRASQVALAADWSDDAAAEKAIKQIVAMKHTGKAIYQALDKKFTMGNRDLSVKQFDIKGGSDLGDWSKGFSLNVSWPKTTTTQRIAVAVGAAAGVLIGGPLAMGAGAVLGRFIVDAGPNGQKREVDIKEMVSALNKIKDAGVKSKTIRNNAPKKWREHELLVARMKKDIKGGDNARAVVRAISELDRLGWECINGAFAVLYFIVRGVNDVADSITSQAKKEQR